MTLRVFLVQSPLGVHINCSLTVTFAGFNSPVSVLNCHNVEPVYILLNLCACTLAALALQTRFCPYLEAS